MVRVHDVREFPGHIACDGGSRSEIVVPVVDGRGQASVFSFPFSLCVCQFLFFFFLLREVSGEVGFWG